MVERTRRYEPPTLPLSSAARARAGLVFALGMALGGAAFGCSAGVDTAGDSSGETSTSSGAGGAGGAGSSTSASSASSTSVASSTSSGPVGCTDESDCNAFDGACLEGQCINGTCQAVASKDFQGCDDGLFCTENDLCVGGACVGGIPHACPSIDKCHIGTCDENNDTCLQIAGNDGAQCDDLNPCTNAGSCNGGICTLGPIIDCGVYDSQCTVGVCDQVNGCQAVPANEGGFCDDGKNSPCSAGQCQAGVCGSVPANQGGPCDDGLYCTINETCQNALCAGGAPNPCAPPGGCFIGTCDESIDQCKSVPGNDGAVCDDGNLCTSGTTCLAGACINGQAANDGMVCDDGTNCTSGEFCSGGICGGGAGPEVYFSEDFSDNGAGWTLGTEWQIGAATKSVGGVFGEDPDSDHTNTADDGVAGVVIGGNASTNLHAMYWIESPTFDASWASGSIVLGFYRVLNSDYDPFMHNAIEVWNGSTWVEIWKSGPSPGINDAAWTFISHDITAYKNAGMRVRFGFDITSGGVYTIGSWNIDDVLVAGMACP